MLTPEGRPQWPASSPFHGINNIYSGPQQLAEEWCAPMIDGVTLAGGSIALTHKDIAFAFYGDLFRDVGRPLGDEVPSLSPDDIEDGIGRELLMLWWAQAAATDPGVMPPDARTLGSRSALRTALNALSGAKFLVGISERLLAWWLKQVSTYFTDASARASIQRRMTDAIEADTRVVVAHSLGSVVAYEALCAHPEWAITDFVTLGSPLGVDNAVFQRLRPAPQMQPSRILLGAWPGTVERWVNICDTADFIPVEPRLRKRFGDRVTDVAIDNGVRAHDVRRYLAAAETGSAIIAGL